MLPLQGHAAAACPPLPRERLPGKRDGAADTLERPGGQWGTLPGSSSPSPFISRHSRPPHVCRYLWPSVFRTVPAPSLSTPPSSPRSSTRHQAQKHKNPSLGRRGPARWSKISSSPACSQGFNSSVRTSVRNCSRSAASPCHVNIQLLLANNSTSVTACGETLQIPTTSAVEKHFPVPGLAWEGPCPC